MRTFGITVLMVILLVTLFSSATATGTVPESHSRDLVNSERSDILYWHEGASQVARDHAAEMQESGEVHHNPNLADEMSEYSWTTLGENVGEGPSIESIHDAFMDSETHRDNIVDPRYTHIGVGVVVDDDGVYWVVQVFMEKQTFTDVAYDHPFYEEIEWLAENDISNGYDDGTFRPGEPMTRQAMAAFLHRLSR